jgi:arylsulfatase A
VPRKPNIVLILADDLGFGDLSALNGGLSSTPAIDGLMKDGVTLSQHYAASPVCNPSRAALLTGRYPHRTGSIDTLEWRGLDRLALREKTLADLLRPAGYATGLVGKWHLGAFDPRYSPTRRGFDEAVCFRGGMHDYYHWRLERNDAVMRADGRYLTDVWTQEACDFIQRHASEPFFLHLTYNAPHNPFQVPEDEAKPFRDKGQFTWAVSTLYGMVHRMDSGIARVLGLLDRLGLRDDTIVIFASDNGPQFGGAGEMCTTRFNCQYRGAKASVYEGGVRVPAVVRWGGGGLAGGRQVDEMVHFCDWLPTILAMAGVEAPAGGLPLDGGNVLPALRGEKGKTQTRRCWQWNRYTPVISSNAAIRDGDWKLIRPAIRAAHLVPDIEWLGVCMYNYEYFLEHGLVRDPEPAREIPPAPPAELYNLAADPLEQTNVADQYPDISHRLSLELESWFESVERDRRSIDDMW